MLFKEKGGMTSTAVLKNESIDLFIMPNSHEKGLNCNWTGVYFLGMDGRHLYTVVKLCDYQTAYL